MAVNRTAREAPPKATQITQLDWDLEVDLWNSAVMCIDILREFKTVSEQVAALTRVDDAYEYMIAVMPAEDAAETWWWVKGCAIAYNRGEFEAPPWEDTFVFYVPNEVALDDVIIGFGDCKRSWFLNLRAIRDEGRTISYRSRVLSTVILTEELHGPQPTWEAYGLTGARDPDPERRTCGIQAEGYHRS